jgi:type I restriction enzyme M protein
MSEQEFLKELEAKLWRTANTLRSNIAAALYRDVVLGMVFLKYVSDSLEIRRQELREGFSDPEFDYYLGDDADEAFISEELENRDYYIEKNVFWIPKSARWDYIKDNSRLAIGSPLSLGGEFKGVDKFLDDTMDKIEKEKRLVSSPRMTKLTDDFANLGVPRNQIFLVGFSCGGWASYCRLSRPASTLTYSSSTSSRTASGSRRSASSKPAPPPYWYAITASAGSWA